MTKEELLKEIMKLPKAEADNPISTMNSINVDDLMNAIDRLNKIPDYNCLLRENEELKKQLEEYKEQVNKGLYNTCLPYATGYNKAIKDKANQQKEFIKWLENYLEIFDCDNIDEQVGYDMIEGILQKCKSIIGDKQ